MYRPDDTHSGWWKEMADRWGGALGSIGCLDKAKTAPTHQVSVCRVSATCDFHSEIHAWLLKASGLRRRDPHDRATDHAWAPKTTRPSQSLITASCVRIDSLAVPVFAILALALTLSLLWIFRN